jgi:MOSC domain-containing protein YiiM
MEYRTGAELDAGLAEILRSPADAGSVVQIVRRPAVGEREVLDAATLDAELGLIGDTWHQRGEPDRDKQLTIMNARAIALMAGPIDRWGLAGDQLYAELDLSQANLPVGTRLVIGGALVEITDKPHNGCAKFSARFGPEALRFVNSEPGRALRLRGANARVVSGGPIRRGDAIDKA